MKRKKQNPEKGSVFLSNYKRPHFCYQLISKIFCMQNPKNRRLFRFFLYPAPDSFFHRKAYTGYKQRERRRQYELSVTVYRHSLYENSIRLLHQKKISCGWPVEKSHCGCLIFLLILTVCSQWSCQMPMPEPMAELTGSALNGNMKN